MQIIIIFYFNIQSYKVQFFAFLYKSSSVMNEKLNTFTKSSHTNRLLLCLKLGTSILNSIGFGILLKISLGIAIHSEVGQNSLIGPRLGLSNIRHLYSFLSEFPLIPAVVRIDVLLYKVHWGLNTLIEHELVLDPALDGLGHEAQFYLCYW